MTDLTFSLLRLFVAGAGAAGAVLLIRLAHQRARDRERRHYAVSFPRGLRPETVEAVVRLLPGLPTPRFGLSGRASAVFTLIGQGREVTHRLSLPRSVAASFVTGLRAAMPGIGVTELGAGEARLPRLTRARELRLTNTARALNVSDPAATSRTLLSACTDLRREEVLVWQVVVTGSVTPIATAPASVPARLRKDPQGAQGCAIRIAACAATTGRADALVARLLRAAASTSAPQVRLLPRALPNYLAMRRAARAATPLASSPVTLSRPELVALLGWPLGSPAIPGLVLGSRPQLAPSPLVPSGGRVIGRATAGHARPVAVSVRGALEHTLLVAPTGSGKTVLAARLALGDIAAGRGVFVLDPKGSLVQAICERLPEEAISRTIVVDPTDAERPVPIPLLATEPGAIPELAADALVALLRHRYTDLGPRSTDILSSSLYALARVPGSTILDLLRLWTDARYRATVVGRLNGDVALSSFFAWFEKLSESERSFILAAPMNKLRPLVARPLVRAVLAAPRTTFSISEAMRRRQVVLVSLAEGVLGPEATTLLGQVLLARLWTATQGRGTGRAPFFVTVDEAPRFLDAPTDLGEILARSREYTVGLTMVAQSLGQLPAGLRELALNSARTKLAFQSSAADARRLAEEFGPTVTPDMLTGLGPFEGMASVSVGGGVTDPFTFAALPLDEPVPGRAEAVRKASRQTYGVPREEIEASHAPAATPPDGGIGPVGRRPKR